MEPILIIGEKPDEEPNPSTHADFCEKYPTLFAPLQTEGYRRVREGRSCALVAPTSSGKTLAVAAPLFEVRRPAVFVLPFRALIRDMSNELPRIAKIFGISQDQFASVQGGTEEREIAEAVKRDYLMMTPDKLISLLASGRGGNSAALSILLKYDFVFDEVHIYNAMMQTSLLYFIRSVRYWRETRQRKSGFYFLSATFPPGTWRMLQNELGLTEADRIEGRSYTGNVRLVIKPTKTVITTSTGENPIVEDMAALGIETDVVGIFNSAYRAYQISEALKRGLLFIGQDKLSEIQRRRNFDDFMCFPEDYALIGSPAIEAGVDFEARNVVIEESHQDSFVQRFGRAARSGRDAFVLAYSDTLRQMTKAGELAPVYTRAEFLKLLRERVRRSESRTIFAGLAAYAYYKFWKGAENNFPSDFPMEADHLVLCKRLEKAGVDDLLAFRGLTPYTRYDTGEGIGFKALFRKNLKVDPETRRVKGMPDPRIYYQMTPARKPVPAQLEKVVEKEELDEQTTVILAKVKFEIVYGHHWAYWVLLELTRAQEWDTEDDNIDLLIDGTSFRPSDGRVGKMLVRFYDVDV